MPFNDKQITHAIEQGLRRTTDLDNLKVKQITCKDVYFYGLSANTFARCRASIIADDKEQLIELVIKRWVPGGPTDVDMGTDPLPRESLAFAAGIFGPDSLPLRIDAPFVAALDTPESNEHWMVLRDVSTELATFRSPADLSEIHRRYSIALDQLAMMHATWEKPHFQERLKKLNWLVPDSVRLSRGELVARYIEGMAIHVSKLVMVESVKDWIQNARIQPAREAFYRTLPKSEGASWKRHKCDRSALIAAFTAFPTTLVHGDFYPLNIGLRVNNGEETVILIDWEWIGNGCGSLDVAKLLSVGAVLEHAAFDGQGLANYYFERYRAHGGTLFDSKTWKRAYELAEVYHALIVHPIATGLAILDDSPYRACREARTHRLAELITRYLG